MYPSSFIYGLFLICIISFPAYGQKSSFGNGNNKALIIGVGDYTDNRFDLQFPAIDAKGIHDFLKNSLDENNLLLLTDKEANTGNYYTTVSKFLDSSQFRSGDVLLIYFSGHGDAIDENNSFLLLHDLVASNDKNNYHASGTIAISHLKEKIFQLTQKGTVVYLIIDACRTNELPGGANGKKVVTNSIMESKNGERMMFAASPNQESVEGKDFGGGHGLFTYALLRVLNGEGDLNKDSILTFKEISRSTSEIVEDEIVKYNRLQDPYFCCNEFFYEPVLTRFKKNTTLLKETAEVKNGKVNFRSVSQPVEKIIDTTYQHRYLYIKDLIRKIQDDIESWESGKENEFESHLESAMFLFKELESDSADCVYKEHSFQRLSGLFLFLSQDKINRYLSDKDINQFQNELYTFRRASGFSKMIVPYLNEKERKEVLFRQQFLYTRALIENNESDSSEKARILLDALILQKPDAAFLYHTKSLSYVSYDGEQIESEPEFLMNSNSAIRNAPNWSYPYNLRGKYCYFKAKNEPGNENYYDSTLRYYRKAMENDSLFKGSYVNFAEVLMNGKTNVSEIEKTDFLEKLASKKGLSENDHEDLFYILSSGTTDENKSIHDSIRKVFLKKAIFQQLSETKNTKAFKNIQNLVEKTNFTIEDIQYLNTLSSNQNDVNSFLHYSIYRGMINSEMDKKEANSYKKRAVSLNKNIKKEYKAVKEMAERKGKLRKIRARF